MGFAAAAAFAFVSVINLDSFQSSTGTNSGFVAEGNVSASQLPIKGGVGLSAVSAQAQLPIDQPLPGSDNSLDQEKLDEYIQLHSEQTDLHNGQGLMPMINASKDEH